MAFKDPSLLLGDNLVDSLACHELSRGCFQRQTPTWCETQSVTAEIHIAAAVVVGVSGKLNARWVYM